MNVIYLERVNGLDLKMATLEKRTVLELKRLYITAARKCDLISAINTSFQDKSIFQRVPINKKNFNIISIDMGIRNFSYARLQLDKTLPLNRPPIIKEWTKFDVNNWADVSRDASYEPTRYAHISHRIINEIIFDSNYGSPDLILIERQRIRSGKSKNVLEWVFRVNMFESMLHALIYSKTQTEKLVSDTMIIPSSPLKMGKFWEPSSDGKLKNKDSKKFRLILVENWLKNYVNGPSPDIPFAISPGLIDFKELNATKSKTKWLFQTIMKNSRFNIEPKDPQAAKDVQKGDDLTDSLLHSLAWLKWEKQKMILKMEFRESVEAAMKTSEDMYESHVKEMDRILKKSEIKPEIADKPKKKPRKTKTRKSSTEKTD
ncbi:Cruciform cutting endonuclease 1, mitochondrial [Wickerhamomyces ciferrii]|uniref:Cruciform cutting endonuclease 1, mitochondrial n=1 Tax=Wickerhamomyces ciferrii (strain ATCC 14091 / BCRC 22168 / CBS 111 / JCM 3599 / NBRC 0793 / NRRL Y-1031 F-60-10) TaxID=1206466 RepID=K0KSY9_WICCF|nr:Cruciform cutting endonuclease 1, mitochondrial [Wickerhamomyces ciferrii]CCH45167.1 Cruciform cutting endonuclease 1, mitochondrial [Wickerhamomyces ciferrii]